MSHETAAQANESALRFALAINRGMQLLDPTTVPGSRLASDFEEFFKPTTTRGTVKINDIYGFIHQTLFAEWEAQRHLHPQDYSPDIGSAKRTEVATAANALLHDGADSLIQPNGTARTLQPQKLARKLAEFYHEMSSSRPFAYGNRITLEVFLTTLLDQKIFKNVKGYQGGLNFLRLSEAEKEVLRDPRSSIEELTELFENAIDPTIQPRLAVNDETGLPAWPSKKVMIAGTLFLGHESEQKERYVVTLNGGLVKHEIAEQLYREHLAADSPENPKLFPDFQIPAQYIEGYLPNTEHLRAQGKTHIDGVKLREDGAVPLVCFEQDILTGLRQDQQAFEQLFTQVCARKFPGEKSEIFRLAHNDARREGLYEALLEAAGNDKRLHRAVEIAYEHVSAVVDSMDAAKARIFEGKTPVENPVFYMSMGGASAGKGSVKQLIKAECGENWVETSLDDFRNYSDLYQVLVAAEHHADDYVLVERMANNLRDWVKNHALANNYNLLFDGSGIVYPNRYDKIVSDFKEQGYQTRLCAVDAPMEQVIPRVIKRLDEKGRTLPWAFTIGKHADLPASLIPAIDDLKLDKVSLFGNDTDEHKKGRWLAAESFVLSPEEVGKLIDARQNGTLKQEFQHLINSAEKSATLPLLKKAETPEEMEKRYPEMREDNVSFFIHPQDKNRVFVIYDVERLVELAKKGQINRQAGSVEGFATLPQTARFLVQNVSSSATPSR